MLFTTAIGLDFVFRGTERMGLVALSLCVRTGIYAIGVLYLRSRRQPDRLGADLADRRRGERDRVGLAELPEELSAAATAAQPAVPLDHGAARADGLPDPALASGDQSRPTCWSSGS